MNHEIIISGFGGQGVMFAGQLLAYAGLAEGCHVTWIPSYGPEMRGGTAHCTVIVSDDSLRIDFDDKKFKEFNVEIPGDKIKFLSAGEYSRRRVAEAVLLTPWLLFSKKQRDQVFVEYGDGKSKGNKIAGIEVKKKYGMALKSELKALSGKEVVEKEKEDKKDKKKKKEE